MWVPAGVGEENEWQLRQWQSLAAFSVLSLGTTCDLVAARSLDQERRRGEGWRVGEELREGGVLGPAGRGGRDSGARTLASAVERALKVVTDEQTS